MEGNESATRQLLFELYDSPLNWIILYVYTIVLHMVNICVSITDGSYRELHKLPQIYIANHATFRIQMYAITVQICGNFWGTQYSSQHTLKPGCAINCQSAWLSRAPGRKSPKFEYIMSPRDGRTSWLDTIIFYYGDCNSHKEKI